MNLTLNTKILLSATMLVVCPVVTWAQNAPLQPLPQALPQTLPAPPTAATLTPPATAAATPAITKTDSQPLLPTPIDVKKVETSINGEKPADPVPTEKEKVTDSLTQQVANKEKAEKELADKLAAEAKKKDAPLPLSEAGAPLPQDVPSEPSAANPFADMPQIPVLPLNTIDQVAANIDPNQLAGNNNAPRTQEEYDNLLKQREAELALAARQQAMQQARDSMVPMKPEEIRELLGLLRKSQEATQQPVATLATPKVAVETISLDPAVAPPVIKLATGNVTSLTILDQTGQPWPIGDMAFAGPFDVKQPEAGGHVVRITPMKEFARGNISLRMLGLATPLTFVLQAGSDEVHYRFDARIPQPGPNAAAPIIASGAINMAAGNDINVSAILAGIAPKDSEIMTVDGVDGVDGRTSAYNLAGRLYLRTPLTLLSPTWQSSAQSADGMKVYVLDNAPVLLLSDQGTMVRAMIKKPLISTSGLFDTTTGAPRS